jgi:hypothetical protein
MHLQALIFKPLQKARKIAKQSQIAKQQFSSTKKQTSTKFQFTMTKTTQGETLFGFWNFGYCDLFGIYYLEFVISYFQSPITNQQSP